MIAVPRPARRLIAAALFLAAIDTVVTDVRDRLENWRYEDVSRDFRFENSDLFGVGPLVGYLRDHPRGSRPRVMFLGNSVTYGYGLSPAEAVPGQYQRLDRPEKILNVGVNGFDITSAYLVAKASISAIEHAYVLTRTDVVSNPLVAGRVPIDAPDAQRFGLVGPDGLEQRLARLLERWQLYRDSYRLQAALFGTSSRQYLYLHKGDFARQIIAVMRASTAASQPVAADITATAPIAAATPAAAQLDAARRASKPILWEFAELFRRQGKSVVLLQVAGFADWIADPESVAVFNRAFYPHARVVIVNIPAGLTSDGMHFTAAGAAAAARALWRERQVYEGLAR